MRILPNWLEGFQEYCDDLVSPKLFIKWAGIACIAGALERKVWIRSMKMDLYPNIYTFLVAPPGVGKSVMLSVVERLWRGLRDHKVSPTSLTKAALIDSLDDAKRVKTMINGAQTYHLEFNSLLVNAGELGVLLPSYDNEFMNSLTAIYDGNMYEERRRGNDLHIKIKHPQLNIFGGTTPSYLNGILPEGAWDQGFLSRTFLVYADERVIQDIFSEETPQQKLQDGLKSDLRTISEYIGEIKFVPEARDLIREWDRIGGTGEKTAPPHPKLVHYLTRRTQHLLKLCMVSCVMDSGNLIITPSHVQTAMGWLLEMEHAMSEIFKALGAKGDGAVIEEAYHFVYTRYMATKDAIHEQRLVSFLSEKVPAYSVLRIMEVMIKSGQIEQSLTKAGMIGYIPKPRSVH